MQILYVQWSLPLLNNIETIYVLCRLQDLWSYSSIPLWLIFEIKVFELYGVTFRFYKLLKNATRLTPNLNKIFTWSIYCAYQSVSTYAQMFCPSSESLFCLYSLGCFFSSLLITNWAGLSCHVNIRNCISQANLVRGAAW